MRNLLRCLLIAAVSLAARAADKPKDAPREISVRVVGLFDAAREGEFKAVLAQVPGVRVVSVDMQLATAAVTYDPKAKEFAGVKVEAAAQRIANLVGQVEGDNSGVNGRTFAVKPIDPATPPKDKLAKVQANLVEIDCRACALGVHEIVMKLDGVVQAHVDMKAGTVVALADPAKLDAELLRKTLKAREISLRD